MKSAVDVDDAAVQQMVEESVEHAFEDMAARQWIEGKLRAQEVLAATRKGLSECGGELDPAVRDPIEAAMATVESALARDEGKMGQPIPLKAAVAKLDEATKPLADLMMD